MLKDCIGNAVNLESIITALCSGEERWQTVNRFAQQIMGKKEEDEKLEQQRIRLEERQRILTGVENSDNELNIRIEEELEEDEEEVWEEGMLDPGD